MSNTALTVIDIGINTWQLFSHEFPELWENIQKYRQGEKLTTIDHISLVIKTVSVTSKTCTIVLNVSSLRSSNNLTPDQQISLKKIKILISKVKFTNYLTAVLQSGIYSVTHGENPLKSKSLLLDISNAAVYALQIRETISLKTVTRWEHTITVVNEIPKLYSLVVNPQKRLLMWEQTQNCFYFQYDYWFPLFQLNNISLDLKDVKINKTIYSLIPAEHKRNRVFRQFKCLLSKEPICYPVIVLDNSGRPIQPIQLFERKYLINYLRFSHLYPGKEQEINLNQIKEHKGVRRIIKAEIIRLKIPLL